VNLLKLERRDTLELVKAFSGIVFFFFFSERDRNFFFFFLNIYETLSKGSNCE
jgi:hypothetical protein